jgi:hypothetical protein
LTLYAQSDGSRANTLFYAVRSIPEGATCIKKSDTEAEFVWQPNYRQAGTYNLNFIVSDGVQEVSKNIAVTVRDKNGPPEFLPLDSRLSVNEGDLIEFDVKAVDPDNDTVYCDISSPLTLPNRANFDENTGRFSWRPDYFQSGEYTFEFMATDNRNGSVYKTITINVINKPAPPQFDLSTPENVQGYETQRISFVVRAWDPERPDLPVTYQVELLSAKQPESRYRFIASIGRFIWYPGKQDSGDYVFSFTARNQAGDVSEPLIINIHVDDLNVAPVLSPIGDKQVYTGQTLSFKLAATDADSDPITYSSTNLPQGAVLNATTGDFSWTPTQRQAGTYNISFSASDGQAADSKNTTITVLALGNLKVEVIGWRSPRRGSSLGYTDVTVISADKSISRKATTSYYGDPVSFLNLPAGPYTVTASKTGWKTKSRDITISANQTLQLRIDLEYKTPGN